MKWARIDTDGDVWNHLPVPRLRQAGEKLQETIFFKKTTSNPPSPILNSQFSILNSQISPLPNGQTFPAVHVNYSKHSDGSAAKFSLNSHLFENFSFFFIIFEF
ncbi:MAG: hypothetical protein B0D92_04285 [Spirochaeta sp. LUC14_002_19_P3]|nr:MAG: hypothetical protein B0D92_04285 [Spirochaeta sp. LUC14_002_19_P3]